MARTNFQTARKNHHNVDETASYLERFVGGADLAAGRSVWDALTGVEPTAGSAGECAIETMPEELQALVAGNETAAASAWCQLCAAVPWNKASAFDRREAMRAEWSSFSARASAVAELVEGFGWDASDAWQTERETGSQEAALVRRIARLAGRMYLAMKGSAARSISGVVGELHAIEQGSDLGRMLPSERMALTDSMLELALFDRIESRRMLQYSVRGRAPASKGALVLVLDESSSMHENRRVWAKAAALAVARVARDESRPVAVVHFSTSIVVRDLDPASPASVMAMLRSHMGGGTMTARALRAAGEQVERLAGKGADVILVTDGVDPDEPGQAAAIDALGDARLWTVAIDIPVNDDRALRAKAAGYTFVTDADLDNEQTAVAIAAAGKGA